MPRAAPPVVFAIVFPVLLAASGCAVLRDDANALLARGRPVEALEALQQEERSARRGSRCDFVRYALDRGVVHLALGDPAEGTVWVVRADQGAAAAPACLDAENRGKLASAKRSLLSP